MIGPQVGQQDGVAICFVFPGHGMLEEHAAGRSGAARGHTRCHDGFAGDRVIVIVQQQDGKFQVAALMGRIRPNAAYRSPGFDRYRVGFNEADPGQTSRELMDP